MPIDLTIYRAAAVLVAVLYAGAAMLLPLGVIDALYLPDDTYYTLSIARNIAAGLGPSTDGIIQTTGFQPLIALFMQPVFLTGFDGDAALRAVIVTSAIFGAVSIIMAGAIVRRATASGCAAAWAMGLAAASPILFANAMNGLETTLAAFLVLVLVSVAADTYDDSPLVRIGGVGVLAGLAIWARVDSALVILVLLPVAVWRIGVLRTFFVAGVAAVVVAPWALYCLAVGGGFMPESGGAVRQIVAHHAAIGSMTTWSNLVPAALMPTRAVAAIVTPLVAWMIAATLLVPPVLAWRNGRCDAPAVLAVAAIVMVLFYAIYLPAFWFFHRYLNLAALAVVMAFVIALWPVVARLSARPERVGAGLGAAALVVAQAVAHTPFVPVWTGQVQALASGHGYGWMAKDLLRSVPSGATLTAMQSGALNWFSAADVRVVNLDGVVNGAAKNAIHDRAIGAYLKSIGATHFADWDLNRDWLIAVAGQDIPLTKVAAVSDHEGPNKDFTLYRIDWP